MNCFGARCGACAGPHPRDHRGGGRRLGAKAEVDDLDEEDIWPWLEEQRLQGHLEGFIVPRAIHAGHRMADGATP